MRLFFFRNFFYIPGLTLILCFALHWRGNVDICAHTYQGSETLNNVTSLKVYAIELLIWHFWNPRNVRKWVANQSMHTPANCPSQTASNCSKAFETENLGPCNLLQFTAVSLQILQKSSAQHQFPLHQQPQHPPIPMGHLRLRNTKQWHDLPSSIRNLVHTRDWDMFLFAYILGSSVQTLSLKETTSSEAKQFTTSNALKKILPFQSLTSVHLHHHQQKSCTLRRCLLQ